MRKSMSYALTAVLFCLILAMSSVAVLAASGQSPGNDKAGLLTESEKTELESQAEEIASLTGWVILTLTTDDAEGKASRTYGEEQLDAYAGAKEDGVACLLDMDNREISLITIGEARYYLTDDRIDRVLDDAWEEVTDEKYKDTLAAMLSGVEKYYKRGIPDGAYLYDEDTGERTVYHAPKSITAVEALIAVIAAVAAGAAVAGGIIGKYRLKWGSYSYPYDSLGSLELTGREDQLVNKFVTHRRIPRDPPPGSGGGGGGGSTVHTGSGGRSYGGGSRKF